MEDANRSAKRDRERVAGQPFSSPRSLAAIAGFATVYLSFAPSDNGRLAPSVKQGEDGAAVPAGEKAGQGPLAGLNKGAMAAFLARPKPLDLARQLR